MGVDAKTSLSLVLIRYSSAPLSSFLLCILPLMKIFLPPPQKMESALDEKNPSHAFVNLFSSILEGKNKREGYEQCRTQGDIL